MSSPQKRIFECTKCGAQSPKWSGRCLECGSWGTLGETVATEKETRPLQLPSDTISFLDIESGDSPRFKTDISELDQVLGGGIVPGSLILIGGEPGIGKSTLLLQIANTLAKQGKVLYCSGEESAQQIKLRYDRLFENEKIEQNNKNLLFLAEINVEKVCATTTDVNPNLAIIDSIQTIFSSDVQSEAGSISQVRACTVKLLETAKKNNIAIVIVGHVTKEGMVAGPKTLEHLVDTVLYLEGDSNHYFRLLRTVKNRFGSTNEVGIFEMTGQGLAEVTNPSQIFISENQNNISGTVTTVVIEGTRGFLVQIQALTSKTFFGYPQRRAVGFDSNRLQLLIAVLTKRLGLNLGDQDIHVNITGGLKISEPSIDLAVCAAIISAYTNKPIASDTIIFGEVGLGGEIRPVSQIEKRIKEAEKLGFKNIIMPANKGVKAKSSITLIKNISEYKI